MLSVVCLWSAVRKMRRSNSWSEVTFDGMSPSTETNAADGENMMLLLMENADVESNGKGQTGSVHLPQSKHF